MNPQSRRQQLPGKRDSMRSRIVRRFEWPGVEFIAENGGGGVRLRKAKGERLSEKLGFYTEATATAAGLTDDDPGNYSARPRLDLGDSAGRAIFVTCAGPGGGEGRRRARASLDDSSSVEQKTQREAGPREVIDRSSPRASPYQVICLRRVGVAK
jgi:hypothetical protein